MIGYKKTDDCYNEWQQLTKNGKEILMQTFWSWYVMEKCSETTPFSLRSPLNLQTVQAPLLGYFPYILVFRELPPP